MNNTTREAEKHHYAHLRYAGKTQAEAARHFSKAKDRRSLERFANTWDRDPIVLAEIERLKVATAAAAVADRRERMEFLTKVLRFKPSDCFAGGEFSMDTAKAKGLDLVIAGHKLREDDKGRSASVNFLNKISAVQELNKMDGAYTPVQVEDVTPQRKLAEMSDEELEAYAQAKGFPKAAIQSIQAAAAKAAIGRLRDGNG